MVDPLTGVLISTRYRLIGQLGSGESGVVWDARDEQLDLPVAMKELRPPEQAPEEWLSEQLALLRAEARYTGQLAHPNIVAVYDVVSDLGRAWVVMPRVAGRSLAADVVVSGTWDPARAARLGLQLVSALETAHGEGVTHGAVKPSNVFIPTFGAPMLTDFSLMPSSHEADLLGLGQVLYFAVEGRAPQSAGHEPPRNAGPLTEVVEGLLSADPGGRPSLAQARNQLTAALAASAAHLSRSAPTPADHAGPATADHSGPATADQDAAFAPLPAGPEAPRFSRATATPADQVALPLFAGPVGTSPAVAGRATSPSANGSAAARPPIPASIVDNLVITASPVTGDSTAPTQPDSAEVPGSHGQSATPGTAKPASANRHAEAVGDQLVPAPETVAAQRNRGRRRIVAAVVALAVVAVATAAFGILRSRGERTASFQPAAATPAVADTTNPQQPLNLVVSGRSTDTVTLVWDAGIDNVGVTGYRVQRDGAQIGTTPTPDYTDKGLAPNTTHTYTVTAIDAAGNVSAASAAVTATTLGVADTTKPSAPGNLRITGRSTTSIVLTWTAATDDIGVARYEVRRDGSAVAAVAALRYTDTGLTPATSHSYVVVAIDATGNISSPAGPVIGVTLTAPDTTAPSAPGSLRSTGATSTTISLAWAASSDDTGVTNYVVYRNGVLVASPNALTYNDPGLTPATTYTYQVKAIDGAGNVSAPAVVSAATVAPQVSGINIEVSIGAVPSCAVTVTASVAVTTGPVTVQLKVVINSVTSNTSVSFPGSGPATQTVNVGTGSGTQDGTAQVTSTSPNTVTSTKTWTAPDSCRPGFTVTSPTAQAGSCDSPTIGGSVRVTARNNPGSEQYTVQMIIDGSAAAETTITLAPNSFDVINLTSPDPYPNGLHTVSYVVTPLGGSSASSSDITTEVSC